MSVLWACVKLLGASSMAGLGSTCIRAPLRLSQSDLCSLWFRCHPGWCLLSSVAGRGGLTEQRLSAPKSQRAKQSFPLLCLPQAQEAGRTLEICSVSRQANQPAPL